MTTSIDSNVLVGLWDERFEVSESPRRALNQIRLHHQIVICACVHAELVAGPGRTAARIDEILADTRITVDWKLGEDIWRLAGGRFAGYAARRREHKATQPKRLLADFLIGAHAEVNGFALLTMDRRIYRTAFPNVPLTVV